MTTTTTTRHALTCHPISLRRVTVSGVSPHRRQRHPRFRRPRGHSRLASGFFFRIIFLWFFFLCFVFSSFFSLGASFLLLTPTARTLAFVFFSFFRSFTLSFCLSLSLSLSHSLSLAIVEERGGERKICKKKGKNGKRKMIIWRMHVFFSEKKK